jgi:hypothetical protein
MIDALDTLEGRLADIKDRAKRMPVLSSATVEYLILVIEEQQQLITKYQTKIESIEKELRVDAGDYWGGHDDDVEDGDIPF